MRRSHVLFFEKGCGHKKYKKTFYPPSLDATRMGVDECEERVASSYADALEDRVGDVTARQGDNPQRLDLPASLSEAGKSAGGKYRYYGLARGVFNGFTLIELMLVVIIIGILSAMVIPRLAGRSEEARKEAARADINAGLSLALDLYEMDMGRYPDSLESLRSKPSDADNWRGPYVKKRIVDPWGKPYVYKAPGEHNANSYDLYSLGKDGKEGGGDDITNWEEQ